MPAHSPFPPLPEPTPLRPLQGLTILTVEDSRYASEALRLLCLRSGARLRRANCLRAARYHLRTYRPSVLIVDIGLPDGSGLDLINDVASQTYAGLIVIGTSGDPMAEAAALTAGAHDFLEKPVANLALFQETILALLPPERQPLGPRQVNHAEIIPDPVAFHDDLAFAAQLIEDGMDDPATDYLVQFLTGVARSAGDSTLLDLTEKLGRLQAKGAPRTNAMAQLTSTVRDRLTTAHAFV